MGDPSGSGEHMRVVVVGGGLAGVAVAVGLSRSGHDVTLYERASALREAGTAIAIMRNGVQALACLGLADSIRAYQAPVSTGFLRDWRGRPLLATGDQQAQTVASMTVVDRRDLLRALSAPLPAGVVRTATPVDRLDEDEDGVSVVSRGEPVAHADAVVVADGIGGGLRSRLFPGHPGLRRTGRLDLRGILPVPADVDATSLLMSNFIDRRTGVQSGLYPVGTDRLYWFTDSALRGAPPAAGLAREQVLELMADWHPVVPALIRATPAASIYVDAIACLARPLATFAVGRVALIGDAAHGMPPDLGQGASQAFEDAASLSGQLAGAGPGDAAERLRRYDAERRPYANRLLRQARQVSRLNSQTGGIGWLRDALMRAVPSRVVIARLAALYGQPDAASGDGA
jgi:2-polyprenyl-6-methoxyphenol hydroxylase-like FAD-dependent oxidoreductase